MTNDKSLANTNDVQVPSFMVKASKDREGLEEAALYQAKPTLRIIQPQSGADRREEFGVGSVVVMPEGRVVSPGPDAEFTGIPLFFNATFESHSDYNDQASPLVVASSSDPNSEIANRARIRGLRSEYYGPNNEYKMAHVEVLNCIVLIEDGDAAGTIGLITFMKSDHAAGRKLASYLRSAPCDLYGNRVAFQVVKRSAGSNDWLGWKINAPSDGERFVQDEAKFEELAGLHKEWAKLMEAHSDMVVENAPVPKDLPSV